MITVKYKENPSEYEKQYRKTLKDLQRCTRCQKQDAYTLNNHSMCFECSKKMSKRDVKESVKKAQKKLYHERKENSQCVRCGKSIKKGNLCDLHKVKTAKTTEKYRREKGIFSRDVALGNGYCWRCCKNPTVRNKKLCQNCFDKSIKSLEIIWKIRKEQENETCK